MVENSSKEKNTINIEIALNAINHYNFKSPQLEFIKNLENTTFKLSTEQGNYLLRVYSGLHNTIQDIESEAKIIEYLSSFNIYYYQKPIRNNFGNFVSIGEAAGIYKPVSILSWINSPPIGNEIKDISLFEEVGKLIAHIHNKLANWQKPVDFHRQRLDINGLIGDDGAFGYANFGYRYFERETVKIFELVYQRLAEFEALAGKEIDVFGIIHGDLHLNNLILHKNTLAPIDFDDSGWGYYIYDLAVILAKEWGKEEYPEIKTNLFQGYKKIRKIPLEIEEKLKLFISVRYICVALFIAGKLQRQPTFKEKGLQLIPSYMAKLKDIISDI